MGPPTCRFCGLEFGTENELRRHYHDEHEIEGGGETGRGGTDGVVPPHRDDLERTAPDGDSRGEPREGSGQGEHDDDTQPRDATGDDSDSEVEGSGI